MKRIAIICCLCLFLIGCEDENAPATKAKNKQTLSGKGEVIGVLPDDREVIRYEISMGESRQSHWIYIVKGGNSTGTMITTNHLGGEKNAQNRVDVIIDGVQYTPVTK